MEKFHSTFLPELLARLCFIEGDKLFLDRKVRKSLRTRIDFRH